MKILKEQAIARSDDFEKCSYNDCAKTVLARRLCSGHYDQQRTGKMLTPLLRQSRRGEKCLVPGCTKPTLARGFCTGHYQQQRRDWALTDFQPRTNIETPIVQPVKQHTGGRHPLCPRTFIGQRFSRLLVVGIHSDNAPWPSSQKMICQCDCGSECAPTLYNLRFGRTRSCGCLSKEKRATRVATYNAQFLASTGDKICRGHCGRILPIASFYYRAANVNDKLANYCKRCARDYQIRHKYGITRERYEEMTANGCHVCGTMQPGTSDFHIDHDHSCCPGKYTCGKCLRGVLCRSCNLAIGHFGDSPERMRKAADYLERKYASTNDTWGKIS